VLNLCQSSFFCSRYLQDCQADFHPILQEDGKWAAVEKLKFWFLSSFGGRKEVQKVIFALDPAAQNAAWRQKMKAV